jgi:hypothetical protein
MIMNQDTNIERKTKSQIGEVSHLTLFPNEESKKVYFRTTKTCDNYRFVSQVLSNGLNIFLIQNKGKGPPGRAISPERTEGICHEHPPDFIPLGFAKPNTNSYPIEKLMVLNGRNFTDKKIHNRKNEPLFENTLHTEYQMKIYRKILHINHT